MQKILYFTLAILGVGVVGYVGLQPSAPEPQMVPEVTITQAFENFLYAPLYVAVEQGFFAQEGLEVTLITAGGDEKAFAGLLSNEAQFAVGDPTFAAIAGERGQPGVVVASLLKGVPFWGLAKDDSIALIESPSALAGYRVATFPAPSTAYVLQENMFHTGGLSPDIQEGAFGTLLAALDTDQVDIALELEPNVSTAVANGYHVVYALNDYHPEFAITGVTALPGYVEDNPETTQKVVRALQSAMEYIRQNPSATAEFLVTKFPDVPPAVAASAVQNMIDAGVFPDDTVTTQVGWDAAVAVRKEAGDLSSAAAYETYVITRFSENAQ